MKKVLLVAVVMMFALSACGPAPEQPYFTVTCVERPANGPADVPLNHAVVEMSGKANPDLWIEIVAMSSNGDQSFLVSYSGGEVFYSDMFDGYISSIRSPGYVVLSSESSYFVRGWRHSYTEDVPVFAREELVFRTGFDVPSCQ